MPRIAYVNGTYTPLNQAAVGVEDRGLQFADSVYEVWAVRDGRLLDFAGHIERLFRSLSELRIAHDINAGSLTVMLHELRRRNRLRDGLIYLQVTRGEAPRDHAFPLEPSVTVIATARPLKRGASDAQAARGVKVVSAPDIRWGRCDIKTTSLTANVLAKQHAKEHGAYEVWLLDGEGRVTEGSSSNAWIVTPDDVLVTRSASDNILNGITRRGVIAVAREMGCAFEERAFTLDEAFAAKEAFMTNASALATPVVEIDGHGIGSGKPGGIALELRRRYENAAIA